ncbi:dTMP kinase [Parvularcula sp. IMCC14364]|uniref:dTMP kinase n=1 Tax=Parvularcula sp. IMCC14364 TaxID=3067902 RepID=UPI002741532D|nr:dTMP kinase [Parvularcula sp. IMCC14364]
MHGSFITFEGVEGAGKSTQIVVLADWLRDAGYTVMMTREPGGAPQAEQIRDLLVSGDTASWTDMGECLLMNAARTEHLARTIRPALKAGSIVLCDRFMDSTRAYQGGAGGIDMTALRQIERAVVGNTGPDLTFIFDLPVAAGLERAKTRGGDDRFEKKGRAYHERVRSAFLQIAAEEPDRCKVIQADQTQDKVTQDILAIIKAWLPVKGGGHHD